MPSSPTMAILSLRLAALLAATLLCVAACASAAAPAPSSTIAPSMSVVPSDGASPAPSPDPRPSVSGGQASAPAIAVGDGEPWLLYSWYAAGKSTKDIYLVRPDGTDAHKILGDLPGGHTSPSWSPDGSRFAFTVVDDATPNGSIWTAGPDGSGAARLTDGGGACPDGLAHPGWSPDGSKLSFICYPDPDGKQGSVATFDLATGSLTRLMTVTWPEHLDGAPTWSPDGRSLAYSILHWDPTDQFIDGSLIAVIAAAGGKEHRITTFDTNMSDPDWSPDGTELATFSYDMGNMHTTPHASNLYLIKPDGTDQRQLTHSSVDGNMRIVQPRWSPDGTGIVCAVGVSHASNFTTDDLQLAFVDPPGGEPALISPVIHGSQPDLRPTP